MREADLGWLAGVLDGEGYIGMQVRKDGRSTVFLVVNTTSLPLAKKLQEILASLDAEPLPAAVRTVQSRPSRRPFMSIRLTSMANILRALTACRPYLTAKAAEADAMIFYITERTAAERNKSDGIRQLQVQTEALLKQLKKQSRMHVQAARL